MGRHLTSLDKMIKLQTNNFRHQHHSQMVATIYINFKNRINRAYTWKNQIYKVHRIKIKVNLREKMEKGVSLNKCLKVKIKKLIEGLNKRHLKIIMIVQSLIN